MNKNVIIGILLALIILGGGYYVMRDRMPESGEVVTPSPTPSTPSPSPNPPSAGLPTVETGVSTFVSSTTAIIDGKVRPNGGATSYWFEYGETTTLGLKTPAQDIGSGYSTISTPGYIVGLQPTTVYYFRLSAKNRFGTVNGSIYNFQTNNTPPVSGIPPTTRTNNATSITRTTATLSGQVDPNGWQTSYWFEYGKDTNLGSITSFQSAGDGNSNVSVSAALSGLEPLTRYYFRLNAQNKYGSTNGTMVSFVTNGPTNATAPSATTTAASNISTSSARLNGRVNPNGEQTEYWFEYSEDSLLGSLIGSGTPVQILSAGTNTTNVEQNISGLARNTRYYYRLVARNLHGTVRGGIMSFETRN